ncbi:MAG: LLM class flavin-dependent oxidoreductase [Polyangia bacterium]|jgi:alkanesulfonate monooxygenase
MAASFFWTLPVTGDEIAPAGRAFPRQLRDERADRFTIHDRIFQAARAAEVAGFTGALVPWDDGGEDAWIVAASLARQVRRLVLIPELQPGFTTPVYLAKISVSFQRLSGNRLAWGVDLERDPAVRRAHGSTLEGADWLASAGEYLEATRGVWTAEQDASPAPFDYDGRFYAVQKGGLKAPLAGWKLPPTYTSGSSDAVLAFAARHADVHLFDSAEPSAVAAAIARLAEAGRPAGRTVRPGVRLSILARETADEALRDAQAAGWEHRPDRLIGSYDQVAQRLDVLARAGVEQFVLSGRPHVQEAYRVGEQIFPRLAAEARPVAQAA